MKPQSVPTNIDAYISQFPPEIQLILNQMRNLILQAAPESKEVISYQMPAFQYKGILVYFAAYAKHIGFYPTPSAIEKFKSELSEYKTSKGAVQFPINQPLPEDLITRMVQFRVRENEMKADLKVRSKKGK
ncbi:MAG: DUF1801 domain-containing protein [Flavobacteriaceae bacterium]|nr:DUF1801 domain-containing protein [Flavobacteriaceae bacterium]